MLTLLMWLYKSPTGHRKYEPKHIDRLIKMFDRFYQKPYRALCITDWPIEDMPCQAIPMPIVMQNNFRRLWVFSSQCAERIPGRVFTCDIDVEIRRDLTDYLDRPEPLVVMTDPMIKGKTYKYSSSVLHTTGTRTDIWNNLDIEKMDQWYKSQGEKRTGSDMAWLSYYLRNEDVPTFRQYRARLVTEREIPHMEIVHFSGKLKPWDKKAKKLYPWLGR